MDIKFKGNMPKKAHINDAGYDLISEESAVIYPQDNVLIDTGTSIDLPPGYVAYVCPRSGLAARHNVTVANSPGVVDPGYIGPIKVNLSNNGRTAYEVERGDRIAQLIVQKIETPYFIPTAELDPTERGEGGHGSTGK